MEFSRLSPVIGVEVKGIDLAQELSPSDRAALLAQFSAHHLLLFKGQSITPEQQRRFAEVIGPTVTTHITREEDGLMFISNREVAGAVGDGTLPFHSDHSFFGRPDTDALALYAIEVPAQGGETLFANTLKAYEDLPAALKERIVGLHACHRSSARGESAVQPLARVLPERNATVLYVSEFCRDGIIELPGPEGEALLSELYAYLYREEFIYRHKWAVGDFIIWSNRVLQHARTNFDPSQARTLRRSTQGVAEDVIEAQLSGSRS